MTQRRPLVRLPLLSVLVSTLAAGAWSGCHDANGPTPAASMRNHPDLILGNAPFAQKPAPAGAKPTRGGHVVISLLSDPDSLNPYTSTVREAHDIQDLIYPHIALEEPDYDKGPPTFKPGLATKWKHAADGMSIRFTLRTAQWSDGPPITAEDVRFSWQAARDPEVDWRSASSIASEIVDVEVHGPTDLTVRYRRQYPYQLMDISDIRILPKHVYAKVPFAAWRTKGLWLDQAKISGGPWLLQTYTKNQEIVFVPNPKYWDTGKPYLDKVVFRIYESTDTMVEALLAGGIDLMQAVTPERVREVLEHPQLEIYSFISRRYGAIAWNCGRWPFDDPRVRRAMTLAIDRENIVESLFYGFAEVPRSHIISSLWAFEPNLPRLDFDLDAAEALLAEAGWKKNKAGVLEKDGKAFEFTLLTNAGNKVRIEIMDYVQATLKDIGVEVKLKTQDGNQFFEALKSHEYDAGVHGMGVATKVDMRSMWHSAGADGGYNVANYRNKEVDAIIDKARVMTDLEASRPLWSEMQRIVWEEQPETMLYESRSIIGLNKRFQNVRMTSLRTLDNLHEWWIAPDEDR